eukprot:TRINITY_DN77518_c0_g1_i3.p1 TRINITY_DN77518_c0_g1~~TRINITY_DN77518_c0_g1_i3.p1  ORF type:complete len:153 (-),score=6.54 TRINITY_DN77518_c0_g1_i3:29-487(-)
MHLNEHKFLLGASFETCGTSIWCLEEQGNLIHFLKQNEKLCLQKLSGRTQSLKNCLRIKTLLLSKVKIAHNDRIDMQQINECVQFQLRIGAKDLLRKDLNQRFIREHDPWIKKLQFWLALSSQLAWRYQHLFFCPPQKKPNLKSQQNEGRKK